jgi:periplasmic protein TonB
MKRFYFFIFAISLWFGAYAQVDSTKAVGEEIFYIVETPAEFIGGQGAMFKFIATHVSYPKLAREAGMVGKIIIRFVVEKDGSVSNPVALKVISNKLMISEFVQADFKKRKKEFTEKEEQAIEVIEQTLVEEAKKVILMSPKWNSGYQKGEAVRTYLTLPVTFRLE